MVSHLEGHQRCTSVAGIATFDTILCGSLRRMLFLLACMVVKYGVLHGFKSSMEYCMYGVMHGFLQAGRSSLARCLRFICIF